MMDDIYEQKEYKERHQNEIRTSGISGISGMRSLLGRSSLDCISDLMALG
jgi:hypothetical protein